MKKRVKADMMPVLICFIFLIISGCSSNEDPVPEPDKEWDKTRTIKVMFVSNLSDLNPYSNDNYDEVSSYIKASDSHITILDKANVTHAPQRNNPGNKIAVLAGRFPLFVPISTTNSEYMGSSVLFDGPVHEMEQRSVADECRMMPITVDIKQGLTVRTALLSFDAQNQISASGNLFNSAQALSTLITGTVSRNLIPTLQSITSTLPSESYSLEIIENSDKKSKNVIYLFGSSKWKFRNVTEENVDQNLKSFLIEVEFL